MTYKMSTIMYKEICKAIEDSTKWEKGKKAETKDVIEYVNATFGLKGEVTGISVQ